MDKLSENEAKVLAREHLDSDHIKSPREETTKAEELRDFWFWPPSFKGQLTAFLWIDPEAGEEGNRKMEEDIGRYFVERTETDRDYWEALRLITARMLDRSNSIEDPCPRGWLIDMLKGDREAPPKKPGNQTRKYHARDGCIYFAMQALSDDGPISEAAAAAWVGVQINLSPEAVKSIYRKAKSGGNTPLRKSSREH